MLIYIVRVALSLSVAVGIVQPLPSQPPARSAEQAPRESRELVVLVHGMGRTSISMRPLARALEKEGFEVLNWGYSSTCCSIAELGRRLQADLTLRGPAPRRVHFVGHSLGNIIIRRLLTQDNAPERVGNVVMLAPPNQGSFEADRYTRYLGWLLKPMVELRTDTTSTARTLPDITGVPIGVIAGKYDGKVLPGQTHLAGESAHVLVPSMHSFMMFRGDVQRLVAGFLREGRFPAVDGVQPVIH